MHLAAPFLSNSRAAARMPPYLKTVTVTLGKHRLLLHSWPYE